MWFFILKTLLLHRSYHLIGNFDQNTFMVRLILDICTYWYSYLEPIHDWTLHILFSWPDCLNMFQPVWVFCRYISSVSMQCILSLQLNIIVWWIQRSIHSIEFELVFVFVSVMLYSVFYKNALNKSTENLPKIRAYQ